LAFQNLQKNCPHFTKFVKFADFKSLLLDQALKNHQMNRYGLSLLIFPHHFIERKQFLLSFHDHLLSIPRPHFLFNQ